MTEKQVTPQFTKDELLHREGQEAEAFMRFINEGEKYFLKVLTQIENELVNSIISLNPLQMKEFAVLKSQLECLYSPITRVHQDIELGKMAWDRINGIVDKTKGIL